MVPACQESGKQLIICQCQRATLIFLVQFQSYQTRIYRQNLMNSHPYGIPKQLYRASFSPVIETARPSSLNNITYSHSYLTRSPLLRLEQASNTPYPKELSKTSLSLSQSSLQEDKLKTPPTEYYPQSSQPEPLRLLQQKLEELARKVLKNTEDIKTIKKTNKLNAKKDLDLNQELGKLTTRQEDSYQECLSKIKEIQGQLLQTEDKLTKISGENPDKINLKIEDKQLFKIKGVVQQRIKQETAKIKLIIDNQISKISHELRWQIEREKSTVPIKSRMKYPFSSTKIVHTEALEAPYKKTSNGSRMSTRESSDSPRSTKVLMSSETTYFIDREGFLLDEQNYYLLDSEEKMIRLTSKMIQELRREGLLE